MNFGIFFENLTGYRISEVFILLGKTGLIKIVNSNENGIEATELLKRLGWDIHFGTRFLEMLISLNLLSKKDEKYFTTEFSEMFFLQSSDKNQLESLDFEKTLMDSWKTLENTLKTGKREFSTENKDNESYLSSLKTYISSMDDAAKIRSIELWEEFTPDKKGIIMDAGAGSGAFICEFLERNEGWKGIFCDLNDVVSLARQNKRVKKLKDKLTFISSNLLDNPFKEIYEKPDLIILSNFVHCYSETELKSVFESILTISKSNTKILIHDFFKDISWHGALYDIHMMLNTYSGRTYKTDEMEKILSEFGFSHSKTKKLPSHSALMLFEKEEIYT